MASLVLAGPAFATESTIDLRQDLPRTATTKDGGAPQEDNCPGIAADKDGWHFVLPGNKATFVSLTVTFEPGGQQVVTDFSVFPGAEGKHAYVASEAGAKLISASAEIEGSVPQDLFNLSHTCPADETAPAPGDDKPGEDKPGEDEPGEDKPGEDKPGEDEPGEDKPGEDKPGEDKPGDDEQGEPSTTPSTSAPAAPAPSADGTSGDLAETGNGAPIGVLAGVAAALVAGGGYLLARRRTARQH
ncbi:LPXTG cell wall anchor domain-containing protein [Streptomyces sp. 5K101]|uniref:LPXTG cell wall anchor domain-containing protein n=1 Tax=Streptomyces sp. 5K101 TaxID=3390037 RepID=UPI00397533E7